MKAGETPFFEATNVHKRLGEQQVLAGATLAIMPGETLVLLGRSGEGKSVFLKHLLGLLHPDEGSIKIDGEDITQLSERELGTARRKVGVLFQNGALFDSFSVGRNVAFPLVEQGVKDFDELLARVREALEDVEMLDHIDKMPVHLSGGQRKRVALARALIAKPRSLLYDEPTAGLDPIATANIDRLIKGFQTRSQVTSFVITHDLKSVERISDRVAFLREGKIHFLGTFPEMCASDDRALKDFLEGNPDEA